MPRNIDSDALTLVQRQLGLSGIGESKTELLSDDLLQTFEVSGAIRRSRADIATGGWWFGLLSNEHSGADAEVSNINPYSGLVGFNTSTFPDAIDPQKFDVWVHGAMIRRTAGTGTVDATLTFLTQARFMAFGKDDTGTAVPQTVAALPIAHWDGVVDTTNAVYGLNVASGQTYTRINLRMPAQGLLQFESLSTALSNWEMYIILGLFPIGLGSDVST